MTETVSPLRSPEPHHPDQTTMFEAPVDVTYAVKERVGWDGTKISDASAMAIGLTIRLHRLPRQKCVACGHRRVCFCVGLGDVIQSPPMCAKCAGIR